MSFLLGPLCNFLSEILHLDIGYHCKMQWKSPSLNSQPVFEGYQFIEPLISKSLFYFWRMQFLSNFFYSISVCHLNPPYLLRSLTGLKMLELGGRTSHPQFCGRDQHFVKGQESATTSHLCEMFLMARCYVLK